MLKIDLFAGIGGMRLAFESAECRCVYWSEWDKYCQITYKANFSDMPNGDITIVDATHIPNHDIADGANSLNCSELSNS